MVEMIEAKCPVELAASSGVSDVLQYLSILKFSLEPKLLVWEVGLPVEAGAIVGCLCVCVAGEGSGVHFDPGKRTIVWMEYLFYMCVF